ncbi:MAG: DUF2341 domain-containing protein [Thermodesulfobacteriota bacterium]|nr:DUF2341 domain-containing protein [Thermodesulfobacteriota bacterium]
MKYIRYIIFLKFLCVVILSASTAAAWWNEQWQYREKITFDTTTSGANISENLREVTLLVRLHPGNYDFTHGSEDGVDLRFVDDDDKTVLKHHVEAYDALDEIALVWVKAPRLAGDSNQGFIYMYYGNETAKEADDAGGSYDDDQIAVFHLSESVGTPKDSSVYGNHAASFKGASGMPAVIGKGIALNGGGESMIIPSTPSMQLTGGFTFSTWLRIVAPVTDGYLLSWEDANQSLIIGVDKTMVYCRITNTRGQKVETEDYVELTPDSWHFLTVTAVENQSLSIYLDGVLNVSTKLPMKMPEFASDVAIGSDLEGEHSFYGELDELQVARVGRSEAWINASYASQGPEASLYKFGIEEMAQVKGGMPVFYLRTIMKNITLDGWVIIGVLGILSLITWVVVITKTFYMRMVRRENDDFLNSFYQAVHLLDLVGEDKEEEFSSSPLYKVYIAGCHELQMRLADAGKGATRLSERAINTFKAALEEGYVKETQKLNAYLILLTLAISGGPFLGLLGTVWGVMNTFAAMAEAGEANIMAIAPGIASALATTVIGLLVAIPALFAYNFLSSGVKDITATLGIFIDQFSVYADEEFGGRR